MGRVAKPVSIAVAIVIFSVSLFWWSEFLISDACFDAGGVWNWDTNECRGVEGFESRQWPIAMRILQLVPPAVLAAVCGVIVYIAILIVERRREATRVAENA